jgi:uncharacterized protein YdhG (YjbR/CyaY superfamily)
MPAPPKADTVEGYIDLFSPDIQAILQHIRSTIRQAVPEAEECISYNMPTFRKNGVLVHFAAFKRHIGLFPPFSGDAHLEQEVAPYEGPKGSLQFPYNRPIPYDLIARIVKYKASIS